MFAAVGNHVVTLHRDRIGGLEFPQDLVAGAFVAMSMAEVTAVIFPTGDDA